jgi:hypothetical protein
MTRMNNFHYNRIATWVCWGRDSSLPVFSLRAITLLGVFTLVACVSPDRSDGEPTSVVEKADSSKFDFQESSLWKDKDNWKKLRRGMSYEQVRSILGPPSSRESIFWYYEGSVNGSVSVTGKVAFGNRQLISSDAPVFD